jgi:hypothetical protein
MDSVAIGDQHIYKKVLEIVLIAPIPPNQAILARLLNIPDCKIQNAVEFWRLHGMIRVEQGMFYAIQHLN